MNRIALICLFLCQLVAAPAEAEDAYGAIHVRVLQRNAEHAWKVQLSANGTALGPSFSHSDSGFEWYRLRRSHLSQKTTHTSIGATYGPLEQHGCRFKFEVLFSMDNGRTSISLGTYEAPKESGAGSIPLGLGCQDRTAEICSNNTRVQEHIDRSVIQRRVEAYNQFKRELDAKYERERRREGDQSLAGKEAPAPADESDSLNQEIAQQDADLAANQEPPATDTTEAGAETLAAQADEMAFTNQYGQVEPEWAGIFGEIALLREVSLRNEAGERVGQEEEARRAVERQEVDRIVRQFSNRSLLVNLAKDGLRFTPAGDVIDLCEALTGREYCTGEKLSVADRAGAVLGLAIGNRLIWGKVFSTIDSVVIRKAERLIGKVESFSEKAVVESVEETTKITARLTREKAAAGIAFEDPYVPDSLAVTVRTKVEMDYVRVGEHGRWLAEPHVVKGADGRLLSAAEIQKKLALPGGLPDKLYPVRVPAEQRLRISQIGENAYGGDSTLFQYEVLNTNATEYMGWYGEVIEIR